jgi:cellulose 1,4-beta-cellobiosidase
MGNKTFYGAGSTVDTKTKMTVVTQFVTSDGTASGDLTEIRRVYVQNGKVIQNSVSNIAGVEGNSITDKFCNNQKSVFGDNNIYVKYGGNKKMGDAFEKGMVLVMSIWADHAAHMLWLDSSYPVDKDPSIPGVARGTCPTTSGNPDDVVAQSPNASVKFSNIKWGPIGSTYSTGGTTQPNPTTSVAPSPTSGTGTVALWGQCGGINYTGPTTCASGSCKVVNAYYHQCQP